MNDIKENIIFDGSFRAEGMYENMRFVLRLSLVNHDLVNSYFPAISTSSDIPYENLKAYSTFIHENIHWWQHIGSTSGLIYSLSYMAQFYANRNHLLKVISSENAFKPLRSVHLNKSDKDFDTQKIINIVVHNYIDIEFYKMYAFNPKAQIHEIVNNPYFESIGHSYNMVYGHVISIIASIIDREFATLPDIRVWDSKFSQLRKNRVEGYYYASSVHVPPIGLHALYEGQARLNQIQYLSRATGIFSYRHWHDLGYFKGVYVEALDLFLLLTDSNRPDLVNDPIINLFLLVCDFSINPSMGFPLDIETFGDFINNVDAGVRFLRLCNSIQTNPSIKQSIVDCNKDDYVSVCYQLSKISGLNSPIENLEEIRKWVEKSDSIKSLMKEHELFKFNQENMPLRVIFSHFLDFSLDRLNKPEFFCWPGYWMVGPGLGEEIANLWGKHLSLFTDRADKPGVYPRMIPGRKDEDLIETLNDFYNTMPLFDLTRQWVLFDGPFTINYTWLAEAYNAGQAKKWANDIFTSAYGIMLEDVKTY